MQLKNWWGIWSLRNKILFHYGYIEFSLAVHKISSGFLEQIVFVKRKKERQIQELHFEKNTYFDFLMERVRKVIVEQEWFYTYHILTFSI